MSILDWLRKLGILRGGIVKARYTSEKDRPDVFSVDDAPSSPPSPADKGAPEPKKNRE